MSFRRVVVGVILACGLVAWASSAMADPGQSTDQTVQRLEVQNQRLQAELQQMKRRLDRVEAARGDTWLNERRSEEVKTLISEVLADADMRASLLDDGIIAGHDGKHFVLKSADGNFLMNIAGQMQFRFVANWADDPFVDNDTAEVAATPGDAGSAAIPGTPDTVDDESLDQGETGFTLRRTKVKFYGHITANPKIGYVILFSGGRDGGTWATEIAEVNHEFGDGFKIRGGQFKLPFLRQELIGTARQLAVGCSSAAQYFSLVYGQGVELDYSTDTVHLALSVNDGGNMANVAFIEDGTDIALTARADVKLAGDWGQAKDVSAWSGEDFAAFVGGAVHWEAAETGTAAANNAATLWTVDGLIEYRGMGAMAAVMGLHTDNETSANFDDLGVQVELGCFLIPDTLQPFVRYDYIDVDGADEMNLLTAGFNYYIGKHSAKFTLDVVHAFDTLSAGHGVGDPAGSGLGLRDDVDGQDGQTALRGQFQLLF